MDLANEMTGEKNVTRLGAAIAKHARQVVKRRVPHDEIQDNQSLSLVDEAPFARDKPVRVQTVSYHKATNKQISRPQKLFPRSPWKARIRRIIRSLLE